MYMSLSFTSSLTHNTSKKKQLTVYVCACKGLNMHKTQDEGLPGNTPPPPAKKKKYAPEVTVRLGKKFENADR